MTPVKQRNVMPDPNANESRVFVVEPVIRLNLTPANVYGPIEYISEKPLDPFSSRTTQTFVRSRLEELDFNPEFDWFCLVGPTLTLNMTTAVLSRMFPQGFNVLMWDAREQQYTERFVNNPEDL